MGSELAMSVMNGAVEVIVPVGWKPVPQIWDLLPQAWRDLLPQQLKDIVPKLKDIVK